MFGCWCLFAHGRMVAVVQGRAVIVRLDPASRAHALALPDAAPFTPRPGMTMRALVRLPDAVSASRARLRPWLARAHAFAAVDPKLPASSRAVHPARIRGKEARRL